MFPYLDLAGFKARSVMPSADIDLVEADLPGYTATRLRLWQSKINARLRKRYGNALPLGQTPPALVASGVTPPGVTLGGRPTLGSFAFVIQITTGGPVGTAVFNWSSDGGLTFTSGGFTGASVQLGATGVFAAFASNQGNYDTSNVYASGTVVPEIVLEWITALVTPDVYRKRGVNPQDPTIEMVWQDATRALEELKEAADSETGLLDIALADDAASGINTGGPLGSAEQSPYTFTDKQRRDGEMEDAAVVAGGDPDIVS